MAVGWRSAVLTSGPDRSTVAERGEHGWLGPGDQCWDEEGRHRDVSGETLWRPAPSGRGGGAELVPVDSDGVEDLAGFR